MSVTETASQTQTSLREWHVRALTGDDWQPVMQALAPTLAAHYPGGHQWLSRRLDDVVDGRAFAWIVGAPNREPAGVAIETPKGPGRLKLSTLWVAPALRGAGIGAALRDFCIGRWLETDVDSAWLTAGAATVADIGRLLLPAGFEFTCCLPDRYGPGRHEWVLHWRPDGHQLRQYDATTVAPQRRW